MHVNNSSDGLSACSSQGARPIPSSLSQAARPALERKKFSTWNLVPRRLGPGVPQTKRNETTTPPFPSLVHVKEKFPPPARCERPAVSLCDGETAAFLLAWDGKAPRRTLAPRVGDVCYTNYPPRPLLPTWELRGDGCWRQPSRRSSLLVPRGPASRASSPKPTLRPGLCVSPKAACRALEKLGNCF